MEQEYLTIETSKGKLRYKKSGYGQKVMLLFHGFGQNKEVFSELEKDWKIAYTFYSFDLFFHGNSYLETDVERFTQQDFKVFMVDFFERHQIDRVKIVGFSMGGRFVNELIMQFPQKIEEVLYVAPDGIKVNFWFKMATSTSIMRALFKRIVHTPGLFFLIVKALSALKIVHRGLVRFGIHQMDTVEKRLRVYNTWKMIYPFKVSTEKLVDQLNENDIPVRFYFGVYDQIVNEKILRFFIEQLKHKKVVEYRTGHNRLLSFFCNHYID